MESGILNLSFADQHIKFEDILKLYFQNFNMESGILNISFSGI